MYRKWYPPARYLFYPIYRQLRHNWKTPSAAAYLLVWVISGMLHGAVILAFGHPVGAAVFALIFIGLGLAGVGAIGLRQRQRRRRSSASSH